MKRFTVKILLFSIALNFLSCSAPSGDVKLQDFINQKKEIEIESDENNAKVEELGEYIDEAISEGNSNKYLSKFDLDYFINKINGSIGLSGSKKANFVKGLRKGISKFPNEIIDQVNADSFYEFVNYRYDSTKQAYFMLFRLFSEVNGVNYHDYRVSKIGDDFMFNDMYVYLTGENISQTMQRLLLTGMPSNKLQALLKPEKKKDFNKVVEAGQLLKSGQFEKAYKNYNSLESSMKDEKFVLIMKGQVARMFDEDLYKKSMEELMGKYPKDKTLSFNYIDYYLMQEDYTKTLEAVETLKLETKDDFLDYLIGNINYTKGDYSTAKKNFENMMKNHADYHTSYFSYMVCLAKEKKYKETVEVLNKLMSLDYSKSILSEYVELAEYGEENEFEDFIKSKHYSNWKRK